MRRRSILMLPILAASILGCGESAKEQGGVPDPRPTGVPAAVPRPAAPGAQKAWRGTFGKIAVIAVAGEGFANRVHGTLSVFPIVVQVANAEPNELSLDREHDEFLLRTTDGTEIKRTDIWQRADLMTALASMPPDDRARFRYPSSVLPGAYVEYGITFEGNISVASIDAIFVRIASLPSTGVWLTPMEPGRSP
ncbi:MAG: hypothetical protein U0166_18255 [Acidobacteriota bacterium]